MDADSSDLPQVIRCSADRMSENGVYLLGEFILNQVLHDHHFCGRVKSIVRLSFVWSHNTLFVMPPEIIVILID